MQVDEIRFIEFLKIVIAQKRKTLFNNLKEKLKLLQAAALKTAKLKPIFVPRPCPWKRWRSFTAL